MYVYVCQLRRTIGVYKYEQLNIQDVKVKSTQRTLRGNITVLLISLLLKFAYRGLYIEMDS